MTAAPNTLHPAQKHFADEWLKDNNGPRAYKCAYPKVKADTTARANASRLLANANVNAYIVSKQAELGVRNDITQDRILEEEARLAFSDLRGLFAGESTIPPNELPEDLARAVSSVEIKERVVGKDNIERTYKYRFWDKGRALERISKHLGMYEKDNKQRYGLEEVYAALAALNQPLAEAIKDRLSKYASGD